MQEGHAQVCTMDSVPEVSRGLGQRPLSRYSPCKPLYGTSQPKPASPLKSPRLSGAKTKCSDVAGPHCEERERAVASGQTAKPAASPPPPVTRSSQTNSSDLELGHSGHFRCPDSDSWVSSPGTGAVSPPHRLRARPKYSVHWKQLRSSRLTEAGLSSWSA